MKEYLSLLEDLQGAVVKDNRTGISAASKFGHYMKFDLAKSFPLLTTKRIPTKALAGELLAFLRGATSASVFRDLNCGIWDANANLHGTDTDGNHVENKWLSNIFRKGQDDLGPVYGAQWRNWDHTTYFSSPELIELGLNNQYEDTKLDDEHYTLRYATSLVESVGYEYLGFLSAKDAHVFRKKVDQLAEAVKQLQKNPLNRRILVTGWNPGDLDKVALPPCHVLQHWHCEPLSLEERLAYVGEDPDFLDYGHESEQAIHDKIDAQRPKVPKYKLNLMMYQRSCDTVLGLPFNIASYGLMMHIMCRITGHALGVFHYVTGDTHIYGNHGAAVEEQLQRTPLENEVVVKIAPHLKTLADFEQATPDDFQFENYKHLGKLENETPMAI